MSKWAIFLILILMVAGLTAGALLAHKIAYPETKVVKEEIQKQIIKDVSPKDAFAMMEKDRGNQALIIIDVRTPKEFATGYIENAINIDYYSGSFRDELSKLDRNKTYIVYCRSGNRSGKTIPLMKELGFKRVYNISGGILRWEKDGLPIVGR